MTIEVLKRELTITWDDEETNEKVIALAERAKGIITDKGFAENLEGRQNLCRYIHASHKKRVP